MGGKVNGEWEEKRGALYRYGEDKKIKKIVDDIGISNGLAWSQDKKTFYYADSLALTIDAFDYDVNTGNISKLWLVLRGY